MCIFEDIFFFSCVLLPNSVVCPIYTQNCLSLHSIQSLSPSSSSSTSSSSNLGTGFTRECIRFRENFAQCRATQQPSSDYLQVKLYTGGRWSSCCQDAPWGRSWIPLLCWPEVNSLAVGSSPWWSWGRTNYRRPHCSFFLDKGDLCL